MGESVAVLARNVSPHSPRQAEIAGRHQEFGDSSRHSGTVAAGANPMALKRGIEKAVTAICGSLDREGNGKPGELDKFSKQIQGDHIAQVGTISANNDETIGKIIAEAMKKVGKDGVIRSEERRV